MREIGVVTSDELKELETIYRRKISLSNLFIVLTNNMGKNNEEIHKNIMYEKIVEDMGTVQMKMNEWWKKVSREYHWEFDNTQAWEVNFETGKVFLHDV